MTWSCSELGIASAGTAGVITSAIGVSWNYYLATVLKNASTNWVGGTSVVNSYQSNRIQIAITGLNCVKFAVFHRKSGVSAAEAWHISMPTEYRYTEVDYGFKAYRNSGSDWSVYNETSFECFNWNGGATNTFFNTTTNSGLYSARYPNAGSWFLAAIQPRGAAAASDAPNCCIIGSTSSVGVFDIPNTNDATTHPNVAGLTNSGNLGSTYNSQIQRLDVSIRFNPATLVSAGMNCNEPFAKMVSSAALYLTLSGYKYRWLETTTNSMTVEIYTGTIPTTPETPTEGTLLATFTGIYSGDFTTPDAFGKFFLTNQKTAIAGNSGTATYAKIKGCYSATATPPTLWVPVNTTATSNTVMLSKTSGISAGDTIYLLDMGFKFAIGT